MEQRTRREVGAEFRAKIAKQTDPGKDLHWVDALAGRSILLSFTGERAEDYKFCPANSKNSTQQLLEPSPLLPRTIA